MTRTTKTICDAPGCGVDLTEVPHGVPCWRLTLFCERIPHEKDEQGQSWVYAIALNPPFRGEQRDFCGFDCLKAWLDAGWEVRG
jgi:hypothetical protein